MEFRVIHCHLLSLNKVGSQGRAAVLTFMSLFQGGVKFPTGGEPAAGKGHAGVRHLGRSRTGSPRPFQCWRVGKADLVRVQDQRLKSG